MVEARYLRVARLGSTEATRMRQLIRKYADLPMDLADAALVAACERENISKMFTIDYRDFSLYRPRHVSHFEIVR
jgi:predicted nucleic acid-binding protein